MTRGFLIDATDARFRIPANDAVLDFIRRTNPFAHSDVGSILFELGREVPGAHAYCPSVRSFAYVVLHTDADVIFAIAFGQRGIAFRLSGTALADALADDGAAAPEIGPGWVSFDLWTALARDDMHARFRHCCERALAGATERPA